MTLGERIKYYRKLANKSQEEVGNHLGIGKSSVSEWESGKRPIPIDVVEQLSCFLEVSVPVLMGWDLESNAVNSRNNLSSAALDIARKFDQLGEYSQKVITALVDLELKRPMDYASEVERFNNMALQDRAAGSIESTAL